MGQAPHEVHAYLTNIRTELLEEKASIRIMRKQCRRYRRAWKQESGSSLLGIELDDVTLKTMGDTVQCLIRRFKAIEGPFLEPGSEGIDEYDKHCGGRRRRSSASPYYEHSAYASPPNEKGDRAQSRSRRRRPQRQQDDEDDDAADPYWAQKTQYAKFTLGKRLIWLRKKSEAQQLFDTLNRVQIRRIARQVGGMSVLMQEYGAMTVEAQESLRRIDERMGNIVGVKRVE